MGCSYCCKRDKKEKKPLLSETSKQKIALKRAISLENPQYSLPNTTHSLQHQSLPNNINIIKKNHNFNNNNNNSKLLPTTKFMDTIHHFTKYEIENTFNYNLEIVTIDNYDCHIFKKCLFMAYHNECPLKISPSHIWLLILQNIKLDTNIKIDLMDNENNINFDNLNKYIMNDIENDFSMSDELDDIVTKLCYLSSNDFIKVSQQSSSFLPSKSISLELNGTKQDWISLKTKTMNLLTDKNNKYINNLLPLLDKFINVYNDNNNLISWNYNNWINILFPPYHDMNLGINVLTVNSKQIYSGFIGIIQNKQTMTIETQIGWFIVNKNDL